MFPKGYFKGTIKYYMDNDARYETKDFTAVFTSSSAVISDDFCLVAERRPYLRILGATTQRQLILQIDTTLMHGPDQYNPGAVGDVGCQGATVRMGLWLIDNTRQCPDSPMPMNWLTLGNPELSGCNCGIKDGGQVYLEKYAANLTDVIAGGIYDAKPAGWKGCDCNGRDSDNDGINDTWNVDCARVELTLDFRVLVGSAP